MILCQQVLEFGLGTDEELLVVPKRIVGVKGDHIKP
jgi:hypothetical protein